MATLEVGASAFAKAHPVTPTDTSWENGCARLMWDWCASITKGWVTRGDVSTAAKAMNLSNLFFPVNANDILPGRFVWLTLPGSPDGHVGFVVAGHGLDALIFWATDVLQIKLGNFIGFGTVRQYEASPHKGRFVGVSEDYAGSVPNLSAFENITPTPTIERDITMRLATSTPAATAGGYWVVGNGAPHKFAGTQAQANAFAAAVGPTYVIPAADWASFLAGATPQAGTGGATDLTPVLAAISALSTLESADEKAILAQLVALPDAVRKNIVTALGS